MSKWLDHVKATMKEHPDKKLKEVLQLASKTYKKGGEETATPVKKKRTAKKKT